MKSSAHKALASLQHKHHALIRQLGSLKNELKALKFALAYGANCASSGAITTRVVEADHGAAEKRAYSLFDEQLLRDNIAELELTNERLESDLRALSGRGSPNAVYRDDVVRAERATRVAQNAAAQANSDRDDAKQAVWIYSLLSFVVGVGGTYGTLFAYGLVPGIY